jgi:glutamyl-tRNA reductase
MQAKLGALTAEQLAAIDALTRGLVNKFLHPPMQALKQAARENDSTRVEALCDTWALPSVGDTEEQPKNPVVPIDQSEKKPSLDSPRASETSAVGGK